MTSDKADTYTDQETERRREATLKRMLATPPQPRKGQNAPKKRKPKATKKRDQKSLKGSSGGAAGEG
jgi:hypothetical protein